MKREKRVFTCVIGDVYREFDVEIEKGNCKFQELKKKVETEKDYLHKYASAFTKEENERSFRKIDFLNSLGSFLRCEEKYEEDACLTLDPSWFNSEDPAFQLYVDKFLSQFKLVPTFSLPIVHLHEYFHKMGKAARHLDESKIMKFNQAICAKGFENGRVMKDCRIKLATSKDGKKCHFESSKVTNMVKLSETPKEYVLEKKEMRKIS